MAQRDVEIILLKQLASCLAQPIFVIGPGGDVLYFNESAEEIVGRRFEETGGIGREEWSSILEATDEHGGRLDDSDRPLMVALDKGRPAHRRFWIQGFDGRQRRIEGTAIPLVGQRGLLLGALGLFWDLDRPDGGNGQGGVVEKRHGQHAVETILMRRLASYLATPIFMVDAEGHLIYFNEAAEPILGRRFEEVIAMTREELYTSFLPTEEDGTRMDPDEHPLTIARIRREPAHRRFSIRGFDGVSRCIEATGIPLIGQCQRALGAVGVFWEIEDA